MLIVIGAVIFIVAFFGCCGAIKENACMTLTVSIIVYLSKISTGTNFFSSPAC